MMEYNLIPNEVLLGQVDKSVSHIVILFVNKNFSE